MRVLALILFAGSFAGAQVRWKFTPEPMAVPVSQIAGARDLGRWLIEACKDSPVAVTVTSERVSLVSPSIAWVNWEDAVLVLSARQKRTAAATVARVLQYAGQGAAVALAIASKSNYSWSAGVAVGSGVLPQVVTLVQGEVPPIGPLVSGVKYPVLLPSGGCYTDHRFAAKMRAPQILMVTE